MTDDIEPLLVSVRADTRGFARDVAEMRGALEGSLVGSGETAGRAIETGLLRAIRAGKLGFEDLKKVALAVLAEIAAAAIRGGIGSLLGGKQEGGGLLSALIGAVGAPGRATGGPVSPGRPFWVGERGPELFVPSASGRIEPVATGGVREVRVAITVNAAAGAAPDALGRSSRQVARAVKAALAGVED